MRAHGPCSGVAEVDTAADYTKILDESFIEEPSFLALVSNPSETLPL